MGIRIKSNGDSITTASLMTISGDKHKRKDIVNQLLGKTEIKDCIKVKFDENSTKRIEIIEQESAKQKDAVNLSKKEASKQLSKDNEVELAKQIEKAKADLKKESDNAVMTIRELEKCAEEVNRPIKNQAKIAIDTYMGENDFNVSKEEICTKHINSQRKNSMNFSNNSTTGVDSSGLALAFYLYWYSWISPSVSNIDTYTIKHIKRNTTSTCTFHHYPPTQRI